MKTSNHLLRRLTAALLAAVLALSIALPVFASDDGDTIYINSVSDLRAKVSAHKVGDTITLTIDRNDHERTVDVTLDEMPQDKKR